MKRSASRRQAAGNLWPLTGASYIVAVSRVSLGSLQALSANHRQRLCARPEGLSPMTAHHVHGLDGGPCQFMVVKGTGVYDNVRVGGAEA
jgi:hypothetical protein